MDKTVQSAEELGSVVEKVRKAQGLTQDDLAGLTGLGRRFISELENGKETAQLGKTLLVLRTLGIALSAQSSWSM